MRKLLFLMLLSAALSSVALGQPFATISGNIAGLTTDSVTHFLIRNDVTRDVGTFYSTITSGKFHENISVSNPAYFTLTDCEHYLFGLIEPTDSVSISYNAQAIGSTLSFSGKGSEKSRFRNTLNQDDMVSHLSEPVRVAKHTTRPFDYLFHYVDRFEQRYRHKLDSIQPTLSKESYNLLRADIKGTCLYTKYRSVSMVYNESVGETLAKRKGELSPKARKALETLLTFDPTLSPSPQYIGAVQTILAMEYGSLVVSNKISNNLFDKYNYLQKLLPKNIQVPVLTIFLERDIEIMNQAEDIETVVQKIYKSAQDSIYKNYIVQRFGEATTFKKGMTAPDFTLENERGGENHAGVL